MIIRSKKNYTGFFFFFYLSKEFQSQRDKEKEIERGCLAASLETGDRPFTGIEGTLGFLQELVHVHVSSLGQRRIEHVPGPS